MAKISIQSFLILERTLTKRLLTTWNPIFNRFIRDIGKAIDENDQTKVAELIQTLDLSRALKSNRRFIRFIGMSAFLFGVARITPPKQSVFVKGKKPIPLLNQSVKALVEVIGEDGSEVLRKQVQKAVNDLARLRQEEADLQVIAQKADLVRSNAEFMKAAVGKRTANYLQTVSSLHNSRLAAYGYVLEADTLGLTTYAVSEQIDSDTICPICLFMHGKIFQVDDAREPLNAALSVDNLNDLKTSNPFPKQTKQGLADLRGMSNAQLVSNKWNFPPYHPNCRGILVKVDDRENLEPMEGVGVETPSIENNPDFPDRLEELEFIERLGGSTGADLMQNATGRKFVVKKGANNEHIQNEFAVNQAYRELGISIPTSKLLTDASGRISMVSDFIEGESLDDFLSGSASELEKSKVLKNVQKGFAVDALLGNWDVIGLDRDNIIITKSGKVVRVDTGSGLNFRAQGAVKDTGDFDASPIDLWSMRNRVLNVPSNDSASDVFGSLNYYDIVSQINKWSDQSISGVLDVLKVNGVSNNILEIVQKRADKLREIAVLGDVLKKDKWKSVYADNFSQQIVGLEKAGVFDNLAPSLQLTGGADEGILVDTSGNFFDGLRSVTGEDKSLIMDKFINVMDEQNSPYSLIEDFLEGQGEDSGHKFARSVSAWMSQQRSISPTNYYWEGGVRENFEVLTNWKDNIRNGNVVGIKKNADLGLALTNYHAFTYNILTKMDLPGMNRTTRTILLHRTEDNSVLDGYGVKPGFNPPNRMKKRVISSTSLLNPNIIVGGEEKTFQEVPFHRIFGTYLHSNDPFGIHTSLASDEESEFLALLEGIGFTFNQ